MLKHSRPTLLRVESLECLSFIKCDTANQSSLSRSSNEYKYTEHRHRGQFGMIRKRNDHCTDFHLSPVKEITSTPTSIRDSAKYRLITNISNGGYFLRNNFWNMAPTKRFIISISQLYCKYFYMNTIIHN